MNPIRQILATTLLLTLSLVGCQEVADGLIRVNGVNDLDAVTHLINQLNYKSVPLTTALGSESPFLDPGEGKERIAFEFATNTCMLILMTHNKSTRVLDILFAERKSGIFTKTSAEYYQELVKAIESLFGKNQVNAEDISGKVRENFVRPPDACGTINA